MATALITGASSGIGASFADLLARVGYDLVLVARDEARLDERAEDLRATYGVEVEVLAADLVVDADRDRVEARLADEAAPVEVLINNAGIPTGAAFLRTDVALEERMLRLNVLAVMRLARAVAPSMAARGRGAIINVSSVAGFLPHGTYSATKAWVTSFSQVLAVELERKGIRVVALCPGYVRTEFQARAGIELEAAPGWAWLTPETVAEAGWRAVRQGRVVAVVDGRYRAATALLRLLPLGAVTAGIRLAQRRGLSR